MSEVNYITKIQTTDGTKYPIGSSIWVSTSGLSWNGKTKTEIESEIKNNFINSKNIEWASLKSLRDNSGLVPGMQYRITDYVTTSTQADTRSAGNLFDVIVTAVDTNKLSELAYAIQSERDVTGYFSNSDLNSWELKYCIDNDTTRFGWADEINGKGVIYWMKDEYNNECPYDFKNIQFKRYAITDITSTKLASDTLDNLKSTFVKNNNGGLYFAAKDCSGMFVPSDVNDTSYTINENDSNWYYTFQGFYSVDGSTINKMYDLTVEIFKLTDECISYLQNQGFSADNTENYCGENKIEQFNQEKFLENMQYKGRQILNNIVFIGGLSYCYETGGTTPWKYKTSQIFGNRFGMNCNSNTFGNNYYYNTFGNNCYSNTFGKDCYSNTFGNECYNNTFGNTCNSNTFGNSCTSNTFGNNCRVNTFGNGCRNNTFGKECEGNTFGNICSSNTFGDVFQKNTFGNNCRYNTFVYYCQSNTFGNNCSYNTFGNYYYNNKLGNNIEESQFGNGVKDFSITIYKITSAPSLTGELRSYIRWLVVENGVQYVNAYVTDTTSSSSYCQNVRICLGIQGTKSPNRKTFDITSCINSKLNNVYQPTNSQITNV